MFPCFTDKERGTTAGIQETSILEKTIKGFISRHVCIAKHLNSLLTGELSDRVKLDNFIMYLRSEFRVNPKSKVFRLKFFLMGRRVFECCRSR